MKITKSLGTLIIIALGLSFAIMAHDGLVHIGYSSALGYSIAVPLAGMAVYFAHLFRHSGNMLYLLWAVLMTAGLSYFDATCCVARLQEKHTAPGAESKSRVATFERQIAEAKTLLQMAEQDALTAQKEADAERLGTNGGKAGTGANWRALVDEQKAREELAEKRRSEVRRLQVEQADAQAKAATVEANTNPLANVSFGWLFLGFLVLESAVAVGGWGLSEPEGKSLLQNAHGQTVNVITSGMPRISPEPEDEDEEEGPSGPDGGSKIQMGVGEFLGLPEPVEGEDYKDTVRKFFQRKSRAMCRDRSKMAA